MLTRMEEKILAEVCRGAAEIPERIRGRMMNCKAANKYFNPVQGDWRAEHEIVRLNSLELWIAMQVGQARNDESMSKGSTPGYAFKGTPAQMEQIHISGAAGEVATARYMDVYFPASVGTYAAADLLPDIQVRTRSKQHYDLIVRSKDHINDRYVLVIDLCPNYHIIGWMFGRDARKQQWIQTYDNRPSAWFVPQASLEDPYYLKQKEEAVR